MCGFAMVAWVGGDGSTRYNEIRTGPPNKDEVQKEPDIQKGLQKSQKVTRKDQF